MKLAAMQRHAFELGLLARTGVLLALGVGIASALGLISLPLATRLWNFGVLPLVPLALAWASLREAGELRRFFARIALAWGAWCTVGMLQYPLAERVDPAVVSLLDNIFYGVYYLALLWAIDWAPGLSLRTQLERAISMVGSLFLIGGTLVYVSVLPGWTGGEDAYLPHLVLYVVLDSYIAARLTAIAHRALVPRLRTIYTLLAAGGWGIVLAECSDLAFELGIFESGHVMAIVPWLVAALPPLLSAYAVRAPREPAWRAADGTYPSVSPPVIWLPLVSYGFALPAVHVVLYTTGWGHAEAERVRGYFVLGWLAAVAALVLFERFAVGRRLVRTERRLVETRERVRELTRAREQIEEGERRHLSRELHDELGQLLVALRMELAWLATHARGEDSLVDGRLSTALDLVVSAVGSVRKVAKSLRPRSLDETGLVAALEELVADVGGGGAATVDLTVGDPLPTLPPEAETALYRIARESLQRSLERSRARRVEVRLSGERDRVVLVVRDDGHGQERTDDALSSDLGLLSLRERAHAVGGNASLGPGIDGRGCSVQIELHAERAAWESTG